MDSELNEYSDAGDDDTDDDDADEIEKLKLGVEEHRRDALWSNFLLANYRNCTKISSKCPQEGSYCYRCGKRFIYSIKRSKLWLHLEDGTAACPNCKPPTEWLAYVYQRCERKHICCSSSHVGNTDFSSNSTWLVDMLSGQHTFYCTDN